MLAALAAGKSNQQIADALFVTRATVKTHLAHIYAKLEAKRPSRGGGQGRRAGSFDLGFLTNQRSGPIKTAGGC